MGHKPQHIWRAFKQPVNTGEESHTDTHTLRQEVRPSDHPSVLFLTLSSPVPAVPNKQLLLPFSIFPVKTMTFLKSDAPFFLCLFTSFSNRRAFLCVCRGGRVKLQSNYITQGMNSLERLFWQRTDRSQSPRTGCFSQWRISGFDFLFYLSNHVKPNVWLATSS